MKNIKYIFLSLFAFVAMTGCQKRYPVTPAPAAPEFTFTGTIAGNAVNIQAGVNDYYMFTSYAQDGNGVYDYIGEFRDKNCTSNCSNSLKIDFKDYRRYAILPTSIDSSISPGYYSFATPVGTPSAFYVNFSDTIVNGTPTAYSWNFGDGTTSSQHKPVHVYRHPGIYTVSLTTQTNTCSSTLTNNIVLGQAGNAFQPEFSEYSTSGDSVNFIVTSVNVHVAKMLLDFGDGNSTTGTNRRHTYSTPGVYPAVLTMTDSSGYTAVAHVNAGTQTTTNCYNGFHTTSSAPITNLINLANVTIEWHDAGGTLYTSSDNSQPAISMFKVISVEDYQNNIDGHPTKKIHATITCTLYNGANSIMLSGDAVFSVAYP